MTDSDLQNIANLLYEPGEKFEFGCEQSEATRFIEIAKESYPGKPYCLVKNWILWDVFVTEEVRQAFEARGVQPIFLYSKFVIEDKTGLTEPGDFRRSSLLVRLEEPCFFVTANTVYILVGNGTRKLVEAKHVHAVYF